MLNELKAVDDKTSFDETLLQLRHDSSELNNRIVNLLETQLNGNLKDEIVYYRKIQALFPIISILFHDQTKVDIFVQVINDDKYIQDSLNLFPSGPESIIGVS